MSVRARVVAALTSLVLVPGIGVGAVAAPASATSTLLCTGYQACLKLKMSEAGYATASGTSWWRMYTGHNCTNYAAYRMVKNGMPNVRPWSGGGNASNWGIAMSTITTTVPAVGAVAWWGANVPPAGSAGHVAYVEQVVSATEIIVSQDSWGGDFSWARITRAGGSWPSGFVHFKDVPLVNTSKPTVSGTPKVGGVLTASSGTWTPSGVSLAYQWRADEVNITNATAPTLTLTLAQLGKQISVRVTATKLGYPTTKVFSTSTATVQPGVLTNSGAPTVTGEPRVDSTLTASAGLWSPAPSALTYQWSADGVPIEGANTATFTPDPALVGKSLTVAVTASKPGYTDVIATSSATTAVVPGTLAVLTPATVVGTPRPGQILTLRWGVTTPQASASVQWLRDGVALPGATGPSYNLTTADLGSHLRARLSLTRPGYTPMTTSTAATPRVKAAPRLALTTEPAQGRLRLTVTLTAPGVPTVTGTVRIWSRGVLLKEVTLRQGTATTRLTGLSAGWHRFRVQYLGSRSVSATSTSRSLRIR